MSRSRITHFVVSAAILVGGFFAWRAYDPRQQTAAQTDKPTQAPIPVTMASATQGDFPVYLNGLGTVQGLNTVVVRSRVDGEVTRIAFTEGQIVKQGDLLAQIDPRASQAALDQAKAKKAQDEANLANAQVDLQRYTKLGDFATRQQTDTQRSTVQQLTALLQADDGAIANAQTQLDYTTIRAPIGGVLGFRQVDQGNIVNASTQTGIVTIAQIEPIVTVFTAPESQLTDINAAMKSGPLKVTALTADGRKTLSQGTLSVVNNQVDTATGTVKLKAVFDNADHQLWPGLSVSTRLLISTLKDAITVPDGAIQHGADGLYVFSVDADNKAAVQKVSVGASTDGRTNIEKGLSAGQRVVVAGQYKVQQGSVVANAVAAAGTPPVKGAP